MSIENLIQIETYKFIKSHLSEITTPMPLLGFDDVQDFLNQIQTDPSIAMWCFEEVLSAFMSKNYLRQGGFIECKTINDAGYEINIYKLKDGKNTRYFTIDTSFGLNGAYVYKAKEVEKKICMVETVKWEPISKN